MRLLVVNWLDPENPQAGGAEVHLFAILSRLVARGHHATLICSGWDGCEPSVMIQGVEVRRYGGRHTFALRARGAVRGALAQGGYDLVVEDINKLPLYLARVTRLPLYVIVPHLFGATVFLEAALPIAGVVWLSERAVPRAYRRAAFHAISGSTRDDLVARGVPREAIRVIHPGVDSDWYTPSDTTSRFADPTFLYVGRLKRYKGLETALRAVRHTRERGSAVRLLLVGSGEDRARLERIAGELELGDAVEFRGYATEDDKRNLLRRAWAVVFPSAKEGWGLTNVEAAACGTPAIAADRPGLRESVQHERTGMLVRYGDVQGFAAAMLRLAQEPGLVETLGRQARVFAKTFSWDRTADQTESHLIDTLDQSGPTGGRS